ncbi:MAG TPA: hypothetical protein DCL77_14650 [Prolixibacteraceae bacterium]|jgi:hypothetical protein|nr:hypothetical protein [Prolixibacteraceae bacterium]
MSLKNDVLALAGQGGEATFKQTGLLFKLTGLKWWEVENLPKPTVKQATPLISAIMDWQKDKSLFNNGWEIVETIQLWFPSFNDPKDIHYRGGGKKKGGNGGETESEQPAEQPTPAPTPIPDPKPKNEPKAPKPTPPPAPKPEPKPETTPTPKPKKPAPAAKDQSINDLVFRINAGIKNLWMVGPAGCGKTTICGIVGDMLDLPVTIIPCGAGASATTFLGYKYPERESTPFVGAFTQEGIIVLDEFTALEPQVAQIINGALANGELTATTGTFKRHENCIIIGTSNTFGNGADRMYVSNNQLDSSTINRFAGGIIKVDYSKEYESQFDTEVVNYVWKLRDIITKNSLRIVASTREIQAACLLKAAGMPNWKETLTITWTKDEKALI